MSLCLVLHYYFSLIIMLAIKHCTPAGCLVITLLIMLLFNVGFTIIASALTVIEVFYILPLHHELFQLLYLFWTLLIKVIIVL